jgi:hypothetical protein
MLNNVHHQTRLVIVEYDPGRRVNRNHLTIPVMNLYLILLGDNGAGR